MNTAQFAAYHDISLAEAEAYARGQDAWAAGHPLRQAGRTSAYDAWFAAGWHDADLEALRGREVAA